ncbi:MAG: 30S ribosomal protein S8e [Candidatus Aramenus sulfurataquae]|jgi:small subunit ribosomal protein S8e|uniref:Small ribosomal subunit protein eS8 n=2 Tax=Candidatus Aramenus sulfurataquae TaxID=1326980 RepID=W7KME2_9CREN|nr:MAG: 30S ribosomal protein S8e [Candidatus Aramenus sulfurataquae]MCL7343216.1 30S ribosomal protein S8e [Candidatus Aramenus sulfurataquae]
MGVYQGNDIRKISGGLKGVHRMKRKYEMGSPPTETKLSNKEEREIVRGFGGNLKVKLKYTTYANVVDPNTKTAKKVKVLAVLETPANKEYARRGIIVKGSKIRTELGVAVVTSRPGQDGVVNALLIQQ